jgi:hypothetical protein
MSIWGGWLVCLGLSLISYDTPEQILNIIINDYRRVEENPQFTEGSYYWEDLIYLFPPSPVAEVVINTITDTTHLSRASLTTGAHLAWAVYDGRYRLGDPRIGAWLGNLYPRFRKLGLADSFPETTRWLFGESGDYNLVGGCRWAIFYIGLDSQSYNFIKQFPGNLTVNDLARKYNLPRNDLAIWLISLLRFDIVIFAKEPHPDHLIPQQLQLPEPGITGIGYFFIGE